MMELEVCKVLSPKSKEFSLESLVKGALDYFPKGIIELSYGEPILAREFRIPIKRHQREDWGFIELSNHLLLEKGVQPKVGGDFFGGIYADFVLREMEKKSRGRILGITDRLLYDYKLGTVVQGTGITYLLTRKGILSLWGLKEPILPVVHELGHLFYLKHEYPHSSDCLMSAGNLKELKKEFCDFCLETMRWADKKEKEGMKPIHILRAIEIKNFLPRLRSKPWEEFRYVVRGEKDA
jgi:hypothetical protein